MQTGCAKLSNDLRVTSHAPNATTFCDVINHKMALDALTGLQQNVAMTQKSRVEALGARIARAREAKQLSQSALGKRINQSQSAISFWEKGEREPGRDAVARIAKDLGVSFRWLELGEDDEATPDDDNHALVPIIGRVGADPSCRMVRTVGQASPDMAPRPIGATTGVVALEVDGHSMRGFADDGALIFFENQHYPPEPDLFGEVVVVQIAHDEDANNDEDVLVKRLQRGSSPDLYDLESIIGPTMRDVRIRWVGEITQITPARQARRLIRRGFA